MVCLLIEEHLWWYTHPTFLSSACLANLVVLLIRDLPWWQRRSQSKLEYFRSFFPQSETFQSLDLCYDAQVTGTSLRQARFESNLDNRRNTETSNPAGSEKIDTPDPLHRIEFGPSKFFSKTCKFSSIFYSTLQYSGGGPLSKSMQIPGKGIETVGNNVQTVGTC